MIQSKFSIKDLENLSGIKAHTIRIWEKRYDLLNPKRTDTNIRYYDLEDLKQLLNTSFLLKHKYKISKIAKLELTEIQDIIKNLNQKDNSYQGVLNELKIAMLDFDENTLYQIHHKYTQQLGFEELCEKIYLPFLKLIGILWHAQTISIAHEHFINHFIHKKILVETEKISLVNHQEFCQKTLDKNKQQYILFLPDNELHDLGLLYLNYLLCKKNKNVIYLGNSIMSKELHKAINENTGNILISYFTVKPENEELNDFFTEFDKEIQQKYSNTKLIVIAPNKIDYVNPKLLTSDQKIYNNTLQALEYINTL